MPPEGRGVRIWRDTYVEGLCKLQNAGLLSLLLLLLFYLGGFALKMKIWIVHNQYRTSGKLAKTSF